MELATAIGLLIVGFVILIKGADFLVEGASAIAKQFNISDMIIGLTIVSFGTSAPELVVNIDAAMEGKNAMIMGNILGSNIFNTCLILGTAGIIYPLAVQRATMSKELPFSIFIVLLMFVLCNDAMFLGGANEISFVDGVILLGLFLGFLGYVYKSAQGSSDDGDEEIKSMPLPKSIVYIVLGMLGLVYGGDMVLTNAEFLAKQFGMTERVIGLTVVAIGTSLPELATSVVAAMKKNSDIAVGNVVGSNIFNVLLVLGASAVFSPNPIAYAVAANFDVYFLLAMTGVLFAFLFIGTKGKPSAGGTITTYVIDKWQSAILLITVLGYIVYLLIS